MCVCERERGVCERERITMWSSEFSDCRYADKCTQ